MSQDRVARSTVRRRWWMRLAVSTVAACALQVCPAGYHQVRAAQEESPPSAVGAEPAAQNGAEGTAETAEPHDPRDLTDQNASKNLHSALDMRADQVVGSIAVFVLLLLLLWKLAWGPITTGLDKREESIKHLIDEAQRNHEAAVARLREYEARLMAAAEESRVIIAQAQKDAEKAAERIKADAEAAAQRERNRALTDIQAAKTAALDDIAQKSVDLAVSLAGRIIQKQLNPSDHAKLIREAIEKFPSRN